MPTADQLADASSAGVKVVINLAPFDPATDLGDEGALVRSLGMDYVNIPVDWEHPTTQNLDDFMNAMDARPRDKLLVHCRANYRATAFITLHRILRLGWEKEEALRELRLVWNPDEYPVWKRFIEENLGRRPG